MNDTQKMIYDALSPLCGGQVTNLFIDYFGLQILDDGFKHHLINEGILSDDEDEDKRFGMSVSDADGFDEFCDSWNKCSQCPIGKSKTVNEISYSQCNIDFEKMKLQEE